MQDTNNLSLYDTFPNLKLTPRGKPIPRGKTCDITILNYSAKKFSPQLTQ